MRPPVFIDLGASGAIPSQWADLTRFSVCLAFDADDRDFAAAEIRDAEWLRLLKVNRLVGIDSSDVSTFYLTNSPHCSSSLQPNNEALAPWAFRELFDVQRVTSLPTLSLGAAMSDFGIAYIDWYKSDTQGTDLRLFKSLPEDIQNGVLAADFEPGIIDAYMGEDKLHHVLAYMETRPFFMCEMTVKGCQRLGQEAAARLDQVRLTGSPLQISPGWAEVCYLNSFPGDNRSIRDYLLGWIIATIKLQHGHALWLAIKGHRVSGDAMFLECQKWTEDRIRMEATPEKRSILRRLVNKVKSKLSHV